MSSFVVDASVTLAWCFEDEQDDVSERALDLLRTREAMVPAIWIFEIVNGLVTAERRGRLRASEADLLLQRLLDLPIRVDFETVPSHLLDVARTSKLSAYDAAYLELALRLDVPLASNDRQLRDAVQRAGGRVLGA